MPEDARDGVSQGTRLQLADARGHVVPEDRIDASDYSTAGLAAENACQKNASHRRRGPRSVRHQTRRG